MLKRHVMEMPIVSCVIDRNECNRDGRCLSFGLSKSLVLTVFCCPRFPRDKVKVRFVVEPEARAEGDKRSTE